MIIEVGLYRFQFKWIPVVITLVSFAILARLGFWQLERGQQKTDRLEQIASYRQFDQIDFASLLKIIEKLEPTGINVKLNGQFSTPYRWLLDNKVVKGQPGYDILLALQPDGGEKSLLVNMGWVKGDYANRSELPKITIPSGTVTFNAFVKAKDLASFALSTQSSNHQQWPLRTQQIDIKTLEQQSGLSFYPFIVIAQASEDFGFTHHYQPVVMQPQKHQAYAMQWFLLALAVLIVFIFASRVNPQENPNERA
ncbi:MAG: surfeit locus 1 family protein [Alteromonadaceae bacterium]|jgi:surfeit locus 1 family protein